MLGGVARGGAQGKGKRVPVGPRMKAQEHLACLLCGRETGETLKFSTFARSWRAKLGSWNSADAGCLLQLFNGCIFNFILYA